MTRDPRRTAARTAGAPTTGTSPAAAAGLAVAAGAAAVAGARLARMLPAVAAVGPFRRAFVRGLAGYGAPGHVALTFDDGPDRASTPRFLDVLDRHDVRATFFLLGHALVDDPGLGKEIVAAGHEPAVHGWQHRLLTLRSPRAIADDVRRAYDLVGEVTGAAPRWYRPPYGVATADALRTAAALGMRPVLWTAWGRDWTARASGASVAAAVRRGRADGGTVLLHDADAHSAPGSWRATLAALPDLLAGWRAAGLRVGPLAEH